MEFYEIKIKKERKDEKIKYKNKKYIKNFLWKFYKKRNDLKNMKKLVVKRRWRIDEILYINFVSFTVYI